MSLRRKFLQYLVPLVVVPLLIFGWLAYTELREVSQRNTFARLHDSIHDMRGQMRTILDTAQANLELMTGNFVVRKYAYTENEEERYDLLLPPLLRLFKTYQQAYPGYHEISFVLPNGTEDASYAMDAAHAGADDQTGRAWYKALQHNEKGISATIGPGPAQNSYQLTVAKGLHLYDQALHDSGTDHILKGYVVLRIGLESLYRHIDRASSGNTGLLFMTDRLGRIIYGHPDLDTEDLPAGSTLRELIESTDHAHAGNGGAGTHRQDHDHGHATLPLETVDEFLDGSRLHDNLYVFGRLDKLALVQGSRRLGLWVAMITTITIIMTIFLLYFLLHEMVASPLRKLNRATHAMGEGKLDISLDIESGDEIGELARAFEAMTRKIKLTNEQIRYMAYYDPLTGLPNRTMLLESIERVIKRARHEEETAALLFLDIDNFKDINDVYGHETGDALLQDIAKRLLHCVREQDIIVHTGLQEAGNGMVARLGGDEFIIMLSGLEDALEAGRVARRILDSLASPVHVNRQDFYVGASIGITIFPDDGEDIAILISNADMAMYHAKSMGKNNFQYYSQEMNQATTRRVAMERKLRKALEQGWFYLEYQPQINAATGRVFGFEALLRCRDDKGEQMSPADFIPIAEESGLIVSIGEWVIESACRQMAEWDRAGLPKACVSVNVSAPQFSGLHLGEILKKTCEQYSYDTGRFIVEITESVLMSTQHDAVQVLEKIRSRGFRIALDDFGTGYSSLNYLRRFPIDIVKIDRSFIKEVGDRGDTRAIVESIIRLAHNLDMKVTAEGIETEQERQILVEQGSDYLQGYLLGRPLSTEAATALLAGNNWQESFSGAGSS